MKNKLKTHSGWIVATFSLLALFLTSISNPSTIESSNNTVEKENITAAVSSEPFLGQVIMFGGNFAPRGWAFCDGQLLPIRNNEALFSILGTTYGGDGRTTFGLPDLRGRVPIHEGQGPGLSDYRLGQKGGTEANSLKKVGITAGTDKKVLNGKRQVPNLQPYTTVNFIIALQGIFPSRS